MINKQGICHCNKNLDELWLESIQQCFQSSQMGAHFVQKMKSVPIICFHKKG